MFFNKEGKKQLTPNHMLHSINKGYEPEPFITGDVYNTRDGL